MHVVVVDWLSVKETVADELNKQLRIEENHDCSWQLETLRQTELMIVVCSLFLTLADEKNSKRGGGRKQWKCGCVGGGGGGKTIEMWWWRRWRRKTVEMWWRWWRKTIELWRRWWWWRKTVEFYGLQNYINAQHATIFSVYIPLLSGWHELVLFRLRKLI